MYVLYATENLNYMLAST